LQHREIGEEDVALAGEVNNRPVATEICLGGARMGGWRRWNGKPGKVHLEAGVEEVGEREDVAGAELGGKGG